MRKIFITAGMICVLSSKILFAQLNFNWTERYSGPNELDDAAAFVKTDRAGNVYVAGNLRKSGNIQDFCTIKYSSAGVQQWVEIYQSPANNLDYLYGLAVDDSGNSYITGQSYGIGTYYDYATIKYNSAGVQQWVSRYNDPDNNFESPTAITVDKKGNVYVTGYTNSITGGLDYLTVKYNLNGIQQWVSGYNGPDNDNDDAKSIAVDDSGNVYVTGESIGSGTGYDYATVKYDSSGILKWVERFDGPASLNDVARSIALDSLGFIYVSGNIRTGSLTQEYCTIKYSPSGVQQWIALCDIGVVEMAMILDNESNVYVTGWSYGNYPDLNYCTVKYNSLGAQQWVNNFNCGHNGDKPYSIAADSFGNVYVTGESDTLAWAYQNMLTVEYNSNGALEGVAVFFGPIPGQNIARSVCVDREGNVYVAGGSYGSGTALDFCTIKYTPTTTNLHNKNFKVPEKFSLYQNYPNPFNPSTTIKFDIAPLLDQGGVAPTQVGDGVVTLKIYDILGHEVATLVNQQLKPGSYIIEWNASNYPSGVYFYKLVTDSYTAVKKMILIK